MTYDVLPEGPGLEARVIPRNSKKVRFDAL